MGHKNQVNVTLKINDKIKPVLAKIIERYKKIEELLYENKKQMAEVLKSSVKIGKTSPRKG